MNCRLLEIFRKKQTLDLPSPSDIFTKPDWIWTYSSVYFDQQMRKRIGKMWVNIPFLEDPLIFPIAIADTKSQDPVFDSPHHCMVLDGATPTDHDLMVNWIANKWLRSPPGQQPDANILVYTNPSMGDVVHRLHKIMYVGEKRVWQFKGDNNTTPDPGLVEDSQIKWLVATIVF